MDSKRVRIAYIEWIKKRKPNFFVTFNFGRKVKDVVAQTTMKEFLNRAQRQAYGRRWHNRPKVQKPVAVGFLEHEKTNPHYHVVACVDRKLREVLKANGQELWAKLAPRGQFHWEGIDNLSGLLKYITKELEWNEKAGSVFIYAPLSRLRATRVKFPPSLISNARDEPAGRKIRQRGAAVRAHKPVARIASSIR